VLFFAGRGGVTEDRTFAEITSGALRREGGRGVRPRIRTAPSAGRGWFQLGRASGQDEAAAKRSWPPFRRSRSGGRRCVHRSRCLVGRASRHSPSVKIGRSGRASQSRRLIAAMVQPAQRASRAAFPRSAFFAGRPAWGKAASTSPLATVRAACAALGLWSIHAEMAAPS